VNETSRIPLAGVRGALVLWMFVLSAVAYVDRVNVSIAGQAIAHEFHLSNVQLGWVFSAFVLGYALCQAPAGRIADRIGARFALMLAGLWWGVFTTLITFISPRWSWGIVCLIAVRFSLGVGEAIMYPASNTFVSRWIPSSERGLSNGIIFAGVGFGAGVTPPIITYILLNFGWRASFLVSASIGIFAGLVWFVIARDSPEEHPLLSEQERLLIRTQTPILPARSKGTNISWLAILGNRNIQALTLSYFSYGYVTYIFFSWFFIYLSTVRGVNLKQSSYYAAIPFIAMGLGSPLGGLISDWLTPRLGKWAGRCGLAGVAMVACGLFILLGTQVSGVGLATGTLASGVGALYLSQSSFWSVSADLGQEYAGSVSGVMNMGSQLGGALTSSLTPALAAQFGWTMSFVVAAVLCIVGGLLWLTVDPNEHLRTFSASAEVAANNEA
jgi:MFS transporter, ACS family, glucarate transporter